MALDPDVNPHGVEATKGPGTITPTLLVRLQQADPVAWERLTSLYAPVAYGWCRRAGLNQEDAGDVVQDVFQALWTGIARFRRERPGDTFGGWVYEIARNKIRDYWRWRRGRPEAAGGTTANLRLQETPDGGVCDPEDGSPERGPGSEFRHVLDHIRAGFEPRTWQAFWGTAVDGRAAADVAAELGISPAAVYMARSRVLRRVREEFGDLLE